MTECLNPLLSSSSEPRPRALTSSQVFNHDYLGGAVMFKVKGLSEESMAAGEIRYQVRMARHQQCCWRIARKVLLRARAAAGCRLASFEAR